MNALRLIVTPTTIAIELPQQALAADLPDAALERWELDGGRGYEPWVMPRIPQQR